MSHDSLTIYEKIENFLHHAKKQTEARSVLPKQLNRFPFNRIKTLQRFALKLLELLFRDQQRINRSLISALKETSQLLQKITDLNQHLQDCNSCLKEEVNYLKIDLIQQRRLIGSFHEKRSASLHPTYEKQESNPGEKASLDLLYTRLVDAFRGTRQLIKERAMVYLPVIFQANIGSKDSPILDIGCGRGEWLELLKEKGYVAYGLDNNRVTIEQCKEKGFAVVEGEAIDYLRSIPNESVGAVTGFHIIEHLPFETVIQLLDETLLVLKPGGIAIFETPNPQNILVGSCNFYLDPTHRNPLPSPMIKFFAEARGLSRVEIWNLHPHPLAAGIDNEIGKLPEQIIEYFYGPQDYAVIGYKGPIVQK